MYKKLQITLFTLYSQNYIVKRKYIYLHFLYAIIAALNDLKKKFHSCIINIPLYVVKQNSINFQFYDRNNITVIQYS